MTDEPPIRIAVIGSGPAGFYAAGHLLKDSGGRFEVDMLERLPTPWGLVRSGVAPDHPKIKSVTRVYEKTAAHPRFRYFGNVTFGEHVSREELLAHYHAIVYATGSPLGPAARDTRRRAPRLPRGDGVRRLVQRPSRLHRPRVRPAVGRVARWSSATATSRWTSRACSCSPPRSWRRPTPPTTRSRCSPAAGSREVVILGRRGPAQAAFTNPELLELGELADADVIVDEAELERALAVADPGVEDDITRRRNVEILRSYASQRARRPRQADRAALPALAQPRSCPDEHGRLAAVELIRNELVADAGGGLRAAPTDERETIQAGLAFRAIGYRGIPLPGVPFDERSAVIPNAGGPCAGRRTAARRCPASTSSAGSSAARPA